MRPRPLGVAAAAEVFVGAGCGGWAWRRRMGARPRGVRVGGASNHHAAAEASAVHSERHHGGVHGVRFCPFGLPGMGYGSDVEARIEKAIYACRFMTFLAIAGSLAGSFPCFLKGCVYVMDAFMEYYLHGGGKVILMLVEAIDMYLIGTAMFVFGTGLYELFISNMDIAVGSNLFGLFRLPERPKWLEIQSVSDLKTKLGHVIVMVLLVGIFEKSKRITITSCADLFCFAASIFLSSGCLYLLSRLSSTKGGSLSCGGSCMEEGGRRLERSRQSNPVWSLRQSRLFCQNRNSCFISFLLSYSCIRTLLRVMLSYSFCFPSPGC